MDFLVFVFFFIQIFPQDSAVMAAAQVCRQSNNIDMIRVTVKTLFVSIRRWTGRTGACGTFRHFFQEFRLVEAGVVLDMPITHFYSQRDYFKAGISF